MSRTSGIFVRVEPETKEQAEQILDLLGVSMSNAVEMFLRQVVMQRGIPFEVKLPKNIPVAVGALTQEQFDLEISKGLTDLEEGKTSSAEQVEAEMERDFGV